MSKEYDDPIKWVNSHSDYLPLSKLNNEQKLKGILYLKNRIKEYEQDLKEVRDRPVPLDIDSKSDKELYTFDDVKTGSEVDVYWVKDQKWVRGYVKFVGTYKDLTIDVEFPGIYMSNGITPVIETLNTNVLRDYNRIRFVYREAWKEDCIFGWKKSIEAIENSMK